MRTEDVAVSWDVESLRLEVQVAQVEALEDGEVVSWAGGGEGTGDEEEGRDGEELHVWLVDEWDGELEVQRRPPL